MYGHRCHEPCLEARDPTALHLGIGLSSDCDLIVPLVGVSAQATLYVDVHGLRVGEDQLEVLGGLRFGVIDEIEGLSSCEGERGLIVSIEEFSWGRAIGTAETGVTGTVACEGIVTGAMA